jgi:hypothetical protein
MRGLGTQVIDGQVGLVYRSSGLAEEEEGRIDVGDLGDALERAYSRFNCARVYIA